MVLVGAGDSFVFFSLVTLGGLGCVAFLVGDAFWDAAFVFGLGAGSLGSDDAFPRDDSFLEVELFDCGWYSGS